MPTIDDEVRRDLDNGAPLDATMIRTIASWWHGGQASPLYSLASTGVFSYAAEDYQAEIESTLRQCPADGSNRTERLGLARLADYVRAHVTSAEELNADDYDAWSRAPRRPLPQHLWHHPED